MAEDFSRRYRRYYQSLEPVLQKPKTRMYSTIIFFLMVISLFGWYAIRPTINTIFYLQREIKDKSEVNKKMEDKISALIEAQSTYESIESKITLLDEAIPKDPLVFPYVLRLRDVAKELQASISATQVSSSPVYVVSGDPVPAPDSTKKITPGKPSIYSLSLTVDGNYQNVKQFLDQVTQLRRLASVESISIEKDTAPTTNTEAAPNTVLLKFTTKLQTYYWGENKK